MPIILSKVYRSLVMVIVPVMLLFCLVCKWPVVMVTLSFLLKYFSSSTPLHYWLENVLSAYKNVNNDTPFLLYGYDWLAFAHFILVILFIGPCGGPVKNSWVIEYRLLACLLIFRLAFIAGSLRGDTHGMEADRLCLRPLWFSTIVDLPSKIKRTHL